MPPVDTAIPAFGYQNHISIDRKKRPRGKPMPTRTARANARKSAPRSHVEHILAEQKARRGLLVRTIGIARTKTKIDLADLAYNMCRPIWLDRQASRT